MKIKNGVLTGGITSNDINNGEFRTPCDIKAIGKNVFKKTRKLKRSI